MSGDDKRVEEMLDYMKDAVLHPERHPEHWEDWLRAGRREFLLLNVIYYIQHYGGKEKGVSKEDIRALLNALLIVDDEIYVNIIKPNRPLEFTLRELIEDKLISQTSDGSFLVNPERVTEERLMYWKRIRGKLEKAWLIATGGDHHVYGRKA
ncbi:hypothetical protein [Thermococcus camini]|uniref:Uncharacterized protein n=1 Tax=Thermococcus camini TaxID=2016373 RepID=A0A7G2D8S9_9EURY|nr:hypothetical protein [Thermococcus camini]CAD5244917.1 conserved protein of unknown function [Thermococcus camini]